MAGSSSAVPRPAHASALLVERDPDTRRIYIACLRGADYDTDEAVDGRDALAKALTGQFDAVVTETRLPGIDGFQLCKLLKHDAATRFTPVVIVVGTGRAGADGILIKPCRPETLLMEVRRVCQQSVELSARAERLRAETGSQLMRLEQTLQRSLEASSRSRALSRIHRRGDTASPPSTPPDLRCPLCDRRLTYQRSHIGGVNARHSEQWDYFECTSGCGTFQYRQRTRKLRQVS